MCCERSASCSVVRHICFRKNSIQLWTAQPAPVRYFDSDASLFIETPNEPESPNLFGCVFIALLGVLGFRRPPQDALDAVNPGDTIELGDGQYWEDVKTRVSSCNDGRCIFIFLVCRDPEKALSNGSSDGSRSKPS